MEGLDSELLDNFLPSDYDLTANLFEDEFMLEQITADTDLAAFPGIHEELESWAGGSSASPSPTFSDPNNNINVSPTGSDSDEDKYLTNVAANPYDFLRDVVVDQKQESAQRDTPSPGSTSSSSGCFSDFSSTTNDTNQYFASSPPPPPMETPTTTPQPHIEPVSGLQFVAIPSNIQPHPQPVINSKSDFNSIAPLLGTKTVILSPQDFGQLMKNMKVTRAPPTIQTVVQTGAPNVSLPAIKSVAQVKEEPVKRLPLPLVNQPNRLVDERTFKKQQRLIKNRESANLSRRKKKEFVDSLQETIQGLATEKEQLTRENSQLRTQLLNNLCSRCGVNVQQVTLKGSGPGGGGGGGRGESVTRKTINGYVTKKNSMLLLAMVLTVSLNFGPLNNMLSSSQSAELSSLSSTAAQSPSSADDLSLRRHILWVAVDPGVEEGQRNDSSNAVNYRNSNDTRESSSADDRRFKAPIITGNESLAHGGNSNSSSFKCPDTVPVVLPSPSPQQYINQTENIRIASELHRWIGQPEYRNVTQQQHRRRLRRRRLAPILTALGEETANEVEGTEEEEEEEENFEYDDVNLMPKKYLKSRKLHLLRKSKKTERFPVEQQDQQRQRRRTTTVEQEEAGEVDVFGPPRRRVELKYAELLRELRRRDDTFYVVSFNADHLMLPAMAYNKTERPKMSLMFPAVGFNGTIDEDHIMMMQVDCEVLDTSLVQVREKLIPEHLRRFQNGTEKGESGESGEEEEGVAKVEEERGRNVTQEYGPQAQQLIKGGGGDGPRREVSRKSGGGGGGLVRKPYFVHNRRFDNVTAAGGG